MASVATYKVNSITPIGDHILVKDMQFGDRFSTGGIIIAKDDTKSSGIRPRWAEVFAVGPLQKDVKVGEWVMVKHGRWTRGVKMEIDGQEATIRMIDNNDILLVSEVPQSDETFSTAVTGGSDRRIIDGSMHNSHL